MFRNNVLVAVEALLHRGDPWIIGTTHIGMTKLTLDLFYPCVNPVAEWDGLLRTDIRCWWNVEVVEKSEY